MGHWVGRSKMEFDTCQITIWPQVHQTFTSGVGRPSYWRSFKYREKIFGKFSVSSCYMGSITDKNKEFVWALKKIKEYVDWTDISPDVQIYFSNSSS